MDSAPRVLGSAQLDWTFSTRGHAEFEWQHMARFYLEPGNLHEYPGHDLFNLRASWQWLEGLKLYGRLLCLADKACTERTDFTSFTGERYFPNRPRRFSIGLG